MTRLQPNAGASEILALESELEAQHPLPSVRRIFAIAALTLVIGMGGFAFWGFATPIDRAVVAQGALVAEGRRKSVTLLEPGILRELVVQEGSRVQAGQVLLRLDVTQAQATADQARATYWGGLSRIARLRAEQRDERSLTMPPEVLDAAAASPAITALMDSESQLFRARWEAYDGAIAVQQRQIAQLQEQIRSYPDQRRAAQTQLAAVRARLSGLNELLRSGAASRFRILELQETEARLVGEIASLNNQEAAARQAITQAELQMVTIRLNRHQEVANEMQLAQGTMAQSQQALRAALDVLQRREVTAPEEGIVTDIRRFTPGSSIAAGDPILDLVPKDDRLVAEVRVTPTDIEQVMVGQRANIRLTAYRQRSTPLIPGEVIYVSADRQTDPQGNAFYLARVALDPEALQATGGLTLTAGMPTEAFLLGERRMAAAYLIAPIRDSMRRALRD